MANRWSPADVKHLGWILIICGPLSLLLMILINAASDNPLFSVPLVLFLGPAVLVGAGVLLMRSRRWQSRPTIGWYLAWGVAAAGGSLAVATAWAWITRPDPSIQGVAYPLALIIWLDVLAGGVAWLVIDRRDQQRKQRDEGAAVVVPFAQGPPEA